MSMLCFINLARIRMKVVKNDQKCQFDFPRDAVDNN